jgi:CubicO group peptidase (beta-lactamase class C family)
VYAVGRRGQTRVEAIGSRSIGGDAMSRDTIFRIASVSKPITAVATMILVEECVLRLDDPVDDWLPELANRRVIRDPDGPIDDTVPAHRSITVRDLLTFRSGYGIDFDRPDAPYQKFVVDNGLAGFGPPIIHSPHTPDQWLEVVKELPLLFQPGEKWAYNTGSYILGALIGRASGQSFDAFLRERVFQPLGMNDTGFVVSKDKLDRLATAYDVVDGKLVESEPIDFLTTPAYPDGGAGMLSTVDDLVAFGQMMLSDGRPLLSRASVRLMTTDQLTAGQKAASPFFPDFWDKYGWGFGMAVATDWDGLASPGRYGWDGGGGTSWWADPVEQTQGILLTQRSGYPPMWNVYKDFWTGVYQDID